MKVRCHICRGTFNPSLTRFRKNYRGEFAHEGCAKKIERSLAVSGAIIIGIVALALLA